MELVPIVAVDRSGIIGTGEDVPWEYPEDVEQYRDRIDGDPAIMGRRTFDQMDDPPGDPVIVLTTDESKTADEKRIRFATDPAAAVAMADETGAERAFINGGEQIYRLYVPYASGAFVSEIPEHSHGSKYFPYLGAGWEIERTIAYDTFDLQVYANRDPLPLDALSETG